MKKTGKRFFALAMTLIMIFSLSGCTSTEKDFWKYGWDGVVKGEKVWENPNRSGKPVAEQTDDEEESEEEQNNEQSDENTDTQDAGVPSEQSDSSAASSNTNTKTNSGTSSSSSNSRSNAGSSSSSSSNSSSSSSGSSSSSSSSGSSSSGGSSSSSSSAASDVPTDVASIIDLYKKAGNPIKQNIGATVTKYHVIYHPTGDSNMKGLAKVLVNQFFKDTDDTEEKSYTSKDDIYTEFTVEKENYVCALTPADVKSATAKKDGDNIIVKIYVKDDTSGTNISNKAISSKSMGDYVLGLSQGLLKDMKCTDVWVEGTINAKGQLIDLKTYGIYTLYGKEDQHFSFIQQHMWRISYK